MRKTACTALLALLLFPLAVVAQSEAEPDSLAQQLRAATRWPEAAAEVRATGISSEDVRALFEVARENDYTSREVRRLLAAITASARFWGVDTVVGEVLTKLEAGQTPSAVRDFIIAGPREQQLEPEVAPEVAGGGDGRGAREQLEPEAEPGVAGGGDGQGREQQEDPAWSPGSGLGQGNGMGHAQVAAGRGWRARSGEGPGNRRQMRREEGSGEGANE